MRDKTFKTLEVISDEAVKYKFISVVRENADSKGGYLTEYLKVSQFYKAGIYYVKIGDSQKDVAALILSGDELDLIIGALQLVRNQGEQVQV